MRRAVVISGVGVVSSAGRGSDALVDALRARACTLSVDDRLAALGLRCRLSGRVDVEQAFAELTIAPAHQGFFGRFAQIGAVAALDAVAASGGDRAPSIGRVLVSSAVGPMGELETCFRETLQREPHPSRPRAVTRVTPSFLASYLAGALGAPRGGHLTSCACVGAIEALRDAAHLVGSGAEEACLVGAVEEDSASTFWAFDAQRLLTQARSPEARPRALSGRRGGFAPAGGAAFFVVEAEEASRARGRRALARIGGVALRSEPLSESLIGFPRAAYERAIGEVCSRSDAGIDLVMAHAPPTAADPEELDALDRTLGVVASRTAVRSPKSLFGYALGAAAAIDVALAVSQFGRQELFVNDLDRLEPEVERFSACLLGSSHRRRVSRVLKTAYAQGGVAGAILLEAGAP